MDDKLDPNTFSNYSAFNIRSLHLDIEVCFDSKILKISTETKFTVKQVEPKLLLDTEKLNTRTVHIKVPESSDEYVEAAFELQAETSVGQALCIDLSKVGPLKLDQELLVKIVSETTADVTALQWMEKEETSGKEKPYLYTQCQSRFCRSLFPCQDTPGVKFPYTANVTVEKGLAVVMSAIIDGEGTATGEKMCYKFSQKQPIPAYLFAIAVGNLVKHDFGHRCAVWTESEILDKCAYEFADVESILQIAESICGPYQWTRYDFLVLPMTFPFGGMENPNMTFLSPTLLAGDRSMVSVLAHEITHSWTGNLVTTVSWEHFWLNEGWTRFIEDKIKAVMEKDESYRKFLLNKEQKHLNDSLEEFERLQKPELTALVPNLTNRDPEDAFSAVPYEKGCMLLTYVESLVGGPEAFAPYIKNYVETFKDTPIRTKAWLEHLIKYFPAKADVLKAQPWEQIFTSPGRSVVTIDLDNPLTDKCKEVVQKWTEASTAEDYDRIVAEYPDLKTWSQDLKIAILGSLREHELIWPEEKFEKLTGQFELRDTNNIELRTPWIRMGLKSGIDSSIEPALELVKTCGRMKFLRPVYVSLYENESSRQRAIDTFLSMQQYMNPISANRVAIDLKLKSEQA
ncbi:leukotriene A-4 hydrolase-like isoform X2 [Symsagittifera roscoffensis]|uniref:leukotriene A-4 hydrolase-like isoform X2 n=1 Tax=Symsagittifera roscoffensis TaxID=84072 RepID=UPI00307CBB2F